MFLLYDIFFILFAIVYLPYVLMKRKWHGEFLSRCGFLPSEKVAILREKKNIWVHAVSVGEVLAVGRLIEQLKIGYPHAQIVVSTVTRTGHDLAEKHFPFAVVIYAPLDFSLSVRAYADVIRPQMYISAETEIWPNMFYALHRRRVPIIQVNGRISDKSFKNYRRVRFMVKTILSYVRCFCMQTPDDARRIMAIGAPPERVCVTGNMKFDDISDDRGLSYDQIFAKGGPVFTAGSTHPGEEEIVLKVFLKLRQVVPGLRLVLAPRHVERVDEVAGMIKQYAQRFCRLSEVLTASHEIEEILLVDTIGHLRHLYRYATVVFIGKSLTGRGGQNIIEPAAMGKPVIVGPHMENFRAIMDLFHSADAIAMVRDQNELYETVLSLLLNQENAVSLGNRAKQVVEGQRGAVARTWSCIQKI